jgi:hypothetical protein
MDLSPEEFRSYYLISNFTSPNLRGEKVPMLEFENKGETLEALPAAFDWRQKGVVTAVYNQGQYASSFPSSCFVLLPSLLVLCSLASSLPLLTFKVWLLLGLQHHREYRVHVGTCRPRPGKLVDAATRRLRRCEPRMLRRKSTKCIPVRDQRWRNRFVRLLSLCWCQRGL